MLVYYFDLKKIFKMNIQILCQSFLILFGGYFAIQLIFNSKNFGQRSLHVNSKQAHGYLKPLGISLISMVVMLIVTLPALQIGGFNSAREVIAMIGVFTLFLFIWNIGQRIKIFKTPDGRDYYKKNTYRPLLVFAIILIYFLAS